MSSPHEHASELSSRLFGKAFPTGAGIPEGRGLNPSVLAQIIIPLIKETREIPSEVRNGRLSAELEIIRKASKPKLQVLTDQIVRARRPSAPAARIVTVPRRCWSFARI